MGIIAWFTLNLAAGLVKNSIKLKAPSSLPSKLFKNSPYSKFSLLIVIYFFYVSYENLIVHQDHHLLMLACFVIFCKWSKFEISCNETFQTWGKRSRRVPEEYCYLSKVLLREGRPFLEPPVLFKTGGEWICVRLEQVPLLNKRCIKIKTKAITIPN